VASHWPLNPKQNRLPPKRGAAFLTDPYSVSVFVPVLGFIVVYSSVARQKN
jgi:hypothetical protein